jgi:hypothetical protein
VRLAGLVIGMRTFSRFAEQLAEARRRLVLGLREKHCCASERRRSPIFGAILLTLALIAALSN